MDVDKISALANATNGQKAQSGGKVLEGIDALKASFANMIRVPLVQNSNLFAASDRTVTPPRQDADLREKAPESDYRDNDYKEARVDNTDRDAPRADSRHEPEDNRQAQDRSPQRDDAPNRDDDVVDNFDTDDGSLSQQDASDQDEGQTVETSSDDNSENVVSEEDTAPEETANLADMNSGKNAAGFEVAHDDLIVAAHSTSGDGTVKEAANVLSAVVSGGRATQNTQNNTVGVQNNAVEAGAAGQQANTGNIPQDVMNDEQVQKVLRAVTRLGVGTSPADLSQAAKAAQVPLSEQQAKMLSDFLKLDRPTNINVKVNNQAQAAVSQTSQSLTSAVALQATQDRGLNQTNSNAPVLATGAAQAAANNTDLQGVAQVQVQNAAQNAATADRGITRGAATQVLTATPQVSADASSATTQATNNQPQQIANTPKPQQVQTPHTPEQARPLAHQISVNITKAIANGLDKISINLRPESLGRVEVQLEVGKNGKVTATIIADRPEALELLRNDSRNLERALQDAGLNAKSADLNFSLRDQNENSNEAKPDSQMAEDTDEGDAEEQDGTPEAELAARLLNGEMDQIISEKRIDIRA